MQTWLCVTHVSHFQKSGDYLSFKIADFPFFLIMGKDNILRGFHNVCRHRAYEVTRKPMGSSLVLGCRYHGWIYDTKGNLTKAPEFDQVHGFRREDNGLFQIWVRTNPNGFVFVNFDAKWEVFDPPTMGLDAFAKYCGASKQSKYIAFWQTEANMNWKQASELHGSRMRPRDGTDQYRCTSRVEWR
jgi:phenylpropionate dioxygenase-like ring-hydroxylating dioxygenase large terminal subunit